jgi:spore germination cell wall hydrolase CwlJ-like protein
MTSTTLTDAQDYINPDVKISGWVAKITLVLLMVLSVYACTNLLNWAITERLNNIESVTASPITAEVREKQLACLAKNIYYEAGGEPFEGKVAVAQVTLNRATNSGFPDDICGVIYQKNKMYEGVICQFSWVCNNAGNLKIVNQSVYFESMSVAKKVLLEGFRLPSLKDALYFHGDYINPGWKREKVAHIGHHIFYR